LAQWYSNWSYITITWSGGFGSGNATHIYRNGVEVSYTSNSNGSGAIADDSANPLLIGSAIAGVQNINPSTSNPAKFTGLIDELRVYNRALSSTEAQQLYFITP
jgi:beta-fructofuranosidase